LTVNDDGNEFTSPKLQRIAVFQRQGQECLMKHAYTAISLALALLTQAACCALGQPGNASNPQGHYRSIELKAQHANARDRQSIRDLAHEVICSPHFYQFPDPIAGLLENRVTDAEINFRNNTGHGVSEAQLVDLMNWLGDKFRLPSYTRTTAAQVRTLRMKLAIMSPYFMGSTLSGREIAKGGQVRTEMSPLQALHLLNVLADQKVINPDYQDPSLDIVAAERQRDETPGATTSGKLPSVGVVENRKKQEVRNAISAAGSAMSAQDAYDMVNHALETLQLD
jgi:hypothetical protein